MDSIPAHEVSDIRSTRPSMSSSWASAWRVRLLSWQRGRLVRRCWPWNMALDRVERRPTRADSSTWEAGRPLQTACGYQDSPENMAAFLRAALGPGADDDRVDAYCEGSPDHFDWLVSIGVPFRAAFCDEPNRESADDSGLLFSGGEDSYPFDEIAVPVPRAQTPVDRFRRRVPHGAPGRRRRGELRSREGRHPG